MDYFDSSNGLYYLVFANKDDTYFLPGMVQLRFRGYLHYCLKHAGYQTVLFIDSSETGISLEYYDTESKSLCKKYSEKKLLGRFLQRNNVISEEGSRGRAIVERAAFYRQYFFRMMEESRGTAVVTSIQQFSSLFDQEEQKNQLLESSGRFDTSNAIILTASVNADESIEELARGGSVFSGGVLPEICQILKEKRDGYFHEKLQQYMGDRCLFFNTLEREDIFSIALRAFLTGEDSEKQDILMLEDFVDFVYLWYHSSALRKETADILPENKKRERKIIYHCFLDSKTLQCIEKWLCEHGFSNRARGEKLLPILMKQYPFEKRQRYVYTDHYLIAKIERMHIPDTLLTMYPVRAVEWKNSLAQVKEKLEETLLSVHSHEMICRQNSCVDVMLKSLDAGDFRTFEKALSAIKFLQGYKDDDLRKRDTVWDFYETVFILSEKCFLLEKEIQDYRKRVNEAKKRKSSLISSIEYTREQNRMIEAEMQVLMNGRADDVSGDMMTISTGMQEAIRLDKDIQIMEKLSASKQKELLNLRGSICQVQHTIDICSSGTVSDVSGVLSKAMDMMNQTLQKNNENMQKMEEAPQFETATFGNIWNGSEEELNAIEEEYFRMMESL